MSFTFDTGWTAYTPSNYSGFVVDDHAATNLSDGRYTVNIRGMMKATASRSSNVAVANEGQALPAKTETAPAACKVGSTIYPALVGMTSEGFLFVELPPAATGQAVVWLSFNLAYRTAN